MAINAGVVYAVAEEAVRKPYRISGGVSKGLCRANSWGWTLMCSGPLVSGGPSLDGPSWDEIGTKKTHTLIPTATGFQPLGTCHGHSIDAAMAERLPAPISNFAFSGS